MKKHVLLPLSILLCLGLWFITSCNPSGQESIRMVAYGYRITHENNAFNVDLVVSVNGSPRSGQISNPNIDTNVINLPIGTTDISDTGAVTIGTTDISDTGAVFIGTTDISDMGGTLILNDQNIITVTFNETGKCLFETLGSNPMPSTAALQECFALSVTILAKNGQVVVKRSDNSQVTYNAETNIVFIKVVEGQLCIYLKPKS